MPKLSDLRIVALALGFVPEQDLSFGGRCPNARRAGALRVPAGKTRTCGTTVYGSYRMS